MVKAPVAGLGDVGPAAAPRPGEVDANTLLAGRSKLMYAEQGTHLRPGILLDRDGTIIVDHGYVGSVNQSSSSKGHRVRLPGWDRAGIPVAVVTNQAGVARGLYGIDDVARVHQHIEAHLAGYGARIDLFLYCPYHPAGIVEAFASHQRGP